ncbi:LysR family transcriptional regulator [Bordetella genomosp. 4]|uniref:HTH lysR-type domain-containing protein n=1 Tax=Bordetella genomosp. 4 TaxID=463044 RepID=A0A261UC98_9BORD|nr:LysR family transcriptional regulator [Bordetella genomosp. 4]OZI59225.1 hypothetical protein CAL20_06305 [Bordetella genomosp. 4]
MRLEDLDYFLAVARAGHVGRAADGMGISQPALTKGIRRLEDELKLQLFVRTPKGMELTMPGKAFYQRSLQARRELDEALREAGDLHRGSVGLVRVGVTPVVGGAGVQPGLCRVDGAATRRKNQRCGSTQRCVDSGVASG